MQKCHDCGIGEGQIHKFGCDVERCPFCGDQLIICGCIDEIYGSKIPQDEEWLTKLEEKGRVPYIVYPQICARCGELWPDFYRTTDKEWRTYIPIAERKLIICKDCFDRIKKLIDTGCGSMNKCVSENMNILDGLIEKYECKTILEVIDAAEEEIEIKKSNSKCYRKRARLTIEQHLENNPLYPTYADYIGRAEKAETKVVELGAFINSIRLKMDTAKYLQGNPKYFRKFCL